MTMIMTVTLNMEMEIDAFGDSADENMEKYELRNDSVLEVLSKGDVIALSSASNPLELFYLCKSNQLWYSIREAKG